MFNDPVLITLFFVAFLYSVIFHEIAHGLVAYFYGDDTAKVLGRFSLNPLRHIDLFGSIILPLFLLFSFGGLIGYAKPVPVNVLRLRDRHRSMFFVALAGIATNFLLVVIAGIVISSTLDIVPNATYNLGWQFFLMVFRVNILLGVFNLMPFPGFDGFNALSTFFPHQLGRLQAKLFARFGQFSFVVVLILVYLLLPVISLILRLAEAFFFNLFGLSSLFL
ncbi:MAG: site-2 protease family protein [Candidatus Buchananbacteria bacterium CG10_big_fil_rev_8_21_14_0_10_42_9]|uniref:Site-2 protease family protein n=1 Tax=Candidatus Buchananbacteria bacterium CG10_big_fil_rev_8_21_14_0_10_42_9 TaxID=1974526 RepID=A0A2H0W271_9BACT|nr:MAG: site-2 protease family protein [Candidatus Buchananbacteria bacterium CG10_big_fil_rev_8_21_14_0_10_42_9]